MWDSEEEAWLAQCWVDTSEDSKKGNSQKRDALWFTITNKFNKNKKGWSRGDDQLSSKWRAINKACKEFNGIYNEIKRNWKSGNNDEDILKKSLKEYKNTYVKDFKMKESWDVLKDKPKWYAPPHVGGDYEEADYDDVDYGDDFEVCSPHEPRTFDLAKDFQSEHEMFGTDPFPRPMGRDKAKKAARTSQSSDAATASRSTNSSKMDDYYERKEVLITKKEAAISQFNDTAKLKQAALGIKILKTDMKSIPKKDKSAVKKMKAWVRQKFKEIINISDDEEKGDEEEEDEEKDDEDDSE